MTEGCLRAYFRYVSTSPSDDRHHDIFLFTNLQDPARVHLELEFEVFHVQIAFVTLRDLHNVGAALPPWEYVGVVFERPNEHDGSVGVE